MSSANDLLKTLVSSGYVIFDPLSKRYALSLRIVTLADSITQHDASLRGLLEAARALHKETSESVAILVRNENQMQFVYRSATDYGPLSPCVPIVGTAAGGALLMTMQASQIALAVRPAIRCVAANRRSAETQRLIQRIAGFRAEGFAISDESAHPPGIRAIAIPVTTGGTGAPLIFGFGGRRSFSEMAHKESARKIALMLRQVVSEYVRPH